MYGNAREGEHLNEVQITEIEDGEEDVKANVELAAKVGAKYFTRIDLRPGSSSDMHCRGGHREDNI